MPTTQRKCTKTAPAIKLATTLAAAGLAAVASATAASKPRDVSFPAASSDAEKTANARAAHSSQLERYLEMATRHMESAQNTGNPDDYLRAEAAVQRALRLHPDSYEARRALAWVQTGKHEFHKALAISQQLVKERPDDHLLYGLLGDAHVELGEYELARKAFHRMLELRPGLSSYSRLSYIKELFGDRKEAIDLMARAVVAGVRAGSGPLAWCLVQYGQLHFDQGDLETAENAYRKALGVRPDYYLALFALGRVQEAQRRYKDALELYRKAAEIVPSPDTVTALGDLLGVLGETREAEQQYATVEYMGRLNEIRRGVYSRQLALFYADHDRNLRSALALAEDDLAHRKDIYSHDAAAWVYYKNGRFVDAWIHIGQALRLGTRDASLFFHSGMIAHSQKNDAAASAHLQRALDINPYFSRRGSHTAHSVLEQMEPRHHTTRGAVHAP